MTRVYFVRHAQPEHDWEDDRTRPLTEEGKKDSAIVLGFLKDKKIDAFYCSPYKRSVETIAEAADFFTKEIITDERLREREKGPDGNNHGMFRKRWADHNYHEEGGESIAMVQNRNIEALNEILSDNTDKDIVIGTHGTALSTILNFYEAESVNLTNVTIRNNKTSNSKDGAYGLLFTNVENMTLKNVSINDNNIGKSLIMVWDNDMIWGNDKVNALTAESLTIENNTIGEHILATLGTDCSDTITLTSGSIRGNNTAGIYMVGNLTIGKGMNVQCGITLNNDSDGSVCTLANDGTITGDIASADWAAKDSGLPNYTGTGTHTGSKNNITDLTAPVQP